MRKFKKAGVILGIIAIFIILPFVSSARTTISDTNITNTNLGNFLYYGNGSQLSDISGTQINNNLHWINWTSVSNGTFYPNTNPFSFYNSTSLSLLSQLSNDLNIGNWTLDKTSYYTSTQVNNINTSMKNYVDSTFITNGGDTVTGDYDFNGGWTAGGWSSRTGDLYVQRLFAYNISTLAVNDLVINGSFCSSPGR